MEQILKDSNDMVFTILKPDGTMTAIICKPATLITIDELENHADDYVQ